MVRFHAVPIGAYKHDSEREIKMGNEIYMWLENTNNTIAYTYEEGSNIYLFENVTLERLIEEGFPYDRDTFTKAKQIDSLEDEIPAGSMLIATINLV